MGIIDNEGRKLKKINLIDLLVILFTPAFVFVVCISYQSIASRPRLTIETQNQAKLKKAYADIDKLQTQINNIYIQLNLSEDVYNNGDRKKGNKGII